MSAMPPIKYSNKDSFITYSSSSTDAPAPYTITDSTDSSDMWVGDSTADPNSPYVVPPQWIPDVTPWIQEYPELPDLPEGTFKPTNQQLSTAFLQGIQHLISDYMYKVLDKYTLDSINTRLDSFLKTYQFSGLITGYNI